MCLLSPPLGLALQHYKASEENEKKKIASHGKVIYTAGTSEFLSQAPFNFVETLKLQVLSNDLAFSIDHF